MSDTELSRMTQMEQKFAEIIWENAPVTSPKLVELCLQQLGWKKSTTYTVLKKLCDKGLFRNENALVTVLITKDIYISRQSRKYVEDTFGGSLPRFLAAFISGGKLDGKQAEEIKQLIETYQGDRIS